jgi:hypothetical protein
MHLAGRVFETPVVEESLYLIYTLRIEVGNFVEYFIAVR